MLKDPLLERASDQKKRAAFRQQLRLADKANIFAVWPFPENNGEYSRLVFQYNLSELLLEAFHAESLPKVLPLVHILMQALPSCSTKHSPQLLQFLDRLATLPEARETSFAVRDQLDQILQPWMLPLQQVMADEEVRFDTSALQSNAAFGQSQLQANASTPTDSTAMQPSSMRTPHVEETAFFPQLVRNFPSLSCLQSLHIVLLTLSLCTGQSPMSNASCALLFHASHQLCCCFPM